MLTRALVSAMGWGALAGAAVGLVWVVLVRVEDAGLTLPTTQDDGVFLALLLAVVCTTGAVVGLVAGALEGVVWATLAARWPGLARRLAVPLSVAVFVAVWLVVDGDFAGPIVPRELGSVLTCAVVALGVQVLRVRRSRPDR